MRGSRAPDGAADDGDWPTVAASWRSEVETALIDRQGELPDEAVIAIISDVHAVAASLEAVLRSARMHGASQVWCLGDVVGRGPSPRLCLEMLASLGPCVVTHWLAGNHEREWLGRTEDQPPSDHDAASVIDAHRRELKSLFVGGEPPTYERWSWYGDASVQPTRADSVAYLVHGGAPMRDGGEAYTYTDDAATVGLLRSHAEDRTTGAARLLFAGHTHVPDAWRWHRGKPTQMHKSLYEEEVLDGECHYLNVGSSGGWPRIGDTRTAKPTYGLLRLGRGETTWRIVEVEADLEPERARMIELGYPEKIVGSLAGPGAAADRP